MASQKSKVLDLYKNLLYMGRDYPLGYDFFREKCRNAFLKNRYETNPVKIKQMIAYGKYTLKELEAMYKLRKYRALKQRYYVENEVINDTEKKSRKGNLENPRQFRGYAAGVEKNSKIKFFKFFA